MRYRDLLFAAVFTCSVAPSAVAQSPAAVLGAGWAVLGLAAIAKQASGAPATVGSEVAYSARTIEGNETVRGTITAVDGDSIAIIGPGNSARTISTRTAHLRVHAGSETRWAQGWTGGFLIGGVAGAVVGFASGDDSEDEFLEFSAGEKAAILGVAGAVAGSTIGAFFGAMTRGERWARIARFDPSHVAVSPSPGGVAVAFQGRF